MDYKRTDLLVSSGQKLSSPNVAQSVYLAEEDGATNTGLVDSVSVVRNVETLKNVPSLPTSLRVSADKLRKKLLVLDLNGLLVALSYPTSKDWKPDFCIEGEEVFVRPFCLDFLKFCFKRFDVGIWSSRSRERINQILDGMMGDMKQKLLFVMEESQCTLGYFKNREGKRRYVCFKDLMTIWDQRIPDMSWEKGCYNESNTLLLDDSPYKALLNPAHTAIFPYSYYYQNTNDNSLGPEGDLRIYLEGVAAADNVRDHVAQHPFGQKALTEESESWEFFQNIISTLPSTSFPA